MNLKEIANVAELMTTHDLTEFVIESEELKLVIKRGSAVGPPVVQQAVAAVPTHLPPAVAAAPLAANDAPPAPESPVEAPLGPTINSPIVGTFYSSTAPGTPAFVKPGDEVDEETVVCIVEAMKVMNEIKAEAKGRVKQILVENATPVEYGQPLFELESL